VHSRPARPALIGKSSAPAGLLGYTVEELLKIPMREVIGRSCVDEKQFRSDFYYRLNVFPVRVPPLRERRDDMRLLIEHFVQKSAKQTNKRITNIPRRTMDRMMQWDWPGNIRELENFVERCIILSRRSSLEAPVNELQLPSGNSLGFTLADVEHEDILCVLQQSGGGWQA